MRKKEQESPNKFKQSKESKDKKGVPNLHTAIKKRKRK